MRRYICILAAAGVALTGCGDTRGERTVTGAGIGAAAGAVFGAVTGLDVATGAVVGAAVGGVTGMVTDRSDIDLGDTPLSKSDDGQQQPAANGAAAVQPAAGQPAQPHQQTAAADPETVKTIQTGLARLGYDPGPANGVASDKTVTAIRNFQQDAGLPANGQPSPEVAKKIQEQIAARTN
jgi:hypothetical protein